MIVSLIIDRLRCRVLDRSRDQTFNMHIIHHIQLQICMLLLVLVIHDAGKINMILYTDRLLRFDSAEPRQDCLREFSLI